jgi:hypothetical protein
MKKINMVSLMSKAKQERNASVVRAEVAKAKQKAHDEARAKEREQERVAAAIAKEAREEAALQNKEFLERLKVIVPDLISGWEGKLIADPDTYSRMLEWYQESTTQFQMEAEGELLRITLFKVSKVLDLAVRYKVLVERQGLLHNISLIRDKKIVLMPWDKAVVEASMIADAAFSRGFKTLGIKAKEMVREINRTK